MILIKKLLKWCFNILRLIFLKIKFREKLEVKIFCKKPVYVGKHCSIDISRNGKIVLAEGVYIDDYSSLKADGGLISIAKNSYMNTFCKIVSKEYIEIGENNIFGSNVSIYDHDHDFSKGVKNSLESFVTAKIILKDDIWLCTNVVVTKGVTLENNIVCACNSVITKDLESNSLYGGIPAQRIKHVMN